VNASPRSREGILELLEATGSRMTVGIVASGIAVAGA
jgi:hypothetical protein